MPRCHEFHQKIRDYDGVAHRWIQDNQIADGGLEILFEAKQILRMLGPCEWLLVCEEFPTGSDLQ